MVNKCGCDCNECRSYQKNCNGCQAISGKVYWTEYISEDICPVFKCCEEKKFENCGKCHEIPCKKWYDLKDPSLSEEEHLNSIDQRVEVLKREQK